MKILKPGKPPDTTLSFKCECCGCEFEAALGEYLVDTVLTLKGFVDKAYRSCPTCGCQCSTKVTW